MLMNLDLAANVSIMQTIHHGTATGSSHKHVCCNRHAALELMISWWRQFACHTATPQAACICDKFACFTSCLLGFAQAQNPFKV